jgi:putative transposase
VTNRLRSCGATFRYLGSGFRHETGRYLNNRVENSHLLFRRRERAMLRFRRMRSLQKFASVQASVYNHFNQEGSVLNFVYLARSTRFQILKRRSARQTLWRTGCGLQTIP